MTNEQRQAEQISKLIDAEQKKQQDTMQKEIDRLQQKEYDNAAQEAAKDLEPQEYGEVVKQDQGKQETEGDDSENSSLAQAVSKQSSLTNVFKRGNPVSIASTATGLDSLIGASAAQEVASGDDVEQLKRYSEQIAMEADESAIEAKENR